MVLLSLGVVLVFARRHFHKCRMIDLIASASFGVYLIHNNSVTKPWRWSRWFHVGTDQDSLWLIPYSLMALLRRALTWAEQRLQA